MKILILAATARSLLNFRGDLIKAFRAAGCVVHCVAPGVDADVRETLESWGCTVFEVPLPRATISPLADFKYFVSLRALSASGDYSHVLAYTIKPIVFGLSAARWAGIDNRTALVTGLGFPFIPQAGLGVWLARTVSRLLYRRGLACATNVIFQNPDDQVAATQQLGVHERKAYRVYGSGINLQRFREQPLPEGPTAFLMIGRFLVSKGLAEYLEAARQVKAKYPHAQFRLVGWSEENPASLSRAVLDRYVEDGTVEMLGRLEDVRPALACCHVYVLPSYREGTPRSSLEALATGRALITTDAPGCRETVVDGENGFLVPVRSVPGLVDAMERFISSPGLAVTMGRRSRELAAQRFDVDSVNRDMLRIMGIGSTKNQVTLQPDHGSGA